MVKQIVVAFTMVVGIFAVVSIRLSRLHHGQLQSKGEISSGKQAVHILSDFMDDSISVESKMIRSHYRTLKRNSETKDMSKSHHDRASRYKKNRFNEENTNREQIIDRKVHSGEKESTKPEDEGEKAKSAPSFKEKPWRGKSSSKSSKGHARSKGKRRKKEMKDPKKGQSKLKTESRQQPIPTPNPLPTLSPTNDWISATIQVPEFTLSFGAPQAETEPSLTEYTAVTARTEDFFNTYLSNYFRDNLNSFDSIELQNINRRFRKEDSFQFNILMDYNATISYSRARDTVTPQEHFTILRDAVSPTYILEYVRPIGGSFASVDKVVLGPIIRAGS